MDDLERRRELGNFVRTRRERITPKEAGVSVSGSRRTPGLRREEVAYLASVSVTWYTWLEQGRDITVSSQVLNTVARALRMNPTERAHLFMLARQPLVPALPPADKMPPALQRVLDSLNPNPAYLTGRRWTSPAGPTSTSSRIVEVALTLTTDSRSGPASASVIIRRRVRGHTRVVRVLRWMLPAVTVGLLGLIGAFRLGDADQVIFHADDVNGLGGRGRASARRLHLRKIKFVGKNSDKRPSPGRQSTGL